MYSQYLTWQDIITHREVTKFLMDSFGVCRTISSHHFLIKVREKYPKLINYAVEEEILGCLSTKDDNISFNALEVMTRENGLKASLQGIQQRVHREKEELEDTVKRMNGETQDLARRETELKEREGEFGKKICEAKESLEEFATGLFQKYSNEIMTKVNRECDRLDELQKDIRHMKELALAQKKAVSRNSQNTLRMHHHKIKKLKAELAEEQKKTKVLKQRTQTTSKGPATSLPLNCLKTVLEAVRTDCLNTSPIHSSIYTASMFAPAFPSLFIHLTQLLESGDEEISFTLTSTLWDMLVYQWTSQSQVLVEGNPFPTLGKSHPKLPTRPLFKIFRVDQTQAIFSISFGKHRHSFKLQILECLLLLLVSPCLKQISHSLHQLHRLFVKFGPPAIEYVIESVHGAILVFIETIRTRKDMEVLASGVLLSFMTSKSQRLKDQCLLAMSQLCMSFTEVLASKEPWVSETEENLVIVLEKVSREPEIIQILGRNGLQQVLEVRVQSVRDNHFVVDNLKSIIIRLAQG